MTRPQEIRKEILLQLYGGRPLHSSAALLARRAKKNGENYTEMEILAECHFLCGQGMAARLQDEVSGEIKYGITSKGITEFENS